jgi:hypothetical protein
MKGHLHTDQLLHAVLKKEGGLRRNRRISHVFVMDVPGRDHLLFVTDAAINIAPDLECKVSIVQNAIDLALALGIETPQGRHPVGGRDGHALDPLDARRRDPVQDGRPRPDHGRAGRRAAGDGQCRRSRGRAHQGADRVWSRGAPISWSRPTWKRAT